MAAKDTPKLFTKINLTILQAARANVTYFETKYHGHATEIARELDVNDYDIIVCCSGDGIPHEVINGFIFVQIKVY